MCAKTALALPDKKVKPLVKWAGGKGQLLKTLAEFLPTDITSYIEPFVGGGALFFHLAPSEATIIDSNYELINFYRVVRDQLPELLKHLQNHKNTETHYYRVRAVNPDKLTAPQRAARFLFLNKTGFNGLWRVNSKGQFNVPFGRYKNPRIIDCDNLTLAQDLLRNVQIVHGDFELAENYIKPHSFIYFDPPYHPVSSTANFTSYTASPFHAADQERLAIFFRKLDNLGCKLMLSNSETPLIRELYQNYRIDRVFARRAINCKGGKRGPVAELIIRNY